MVEVTIDFETQSEENLKKTGAPKYAKHESTGIICMSVKFDDDGSQLWWPGQTPPSGLYDALKYKKDFKFCAHNALFEQCIVKHILPKYMPHRFTGFLLDVLPSRWKCTAAKAAACALPRALDGAASALGLPVQKDMDGNRLVKKHMKPTLKWKGWAADGRHGIEPKKWYDDEFELWAIGDYCKTDTDVQRLLDNALPDLTPQEQRLWELNQETNLRGVKIDMDSVWAIVRMIKSEEQRLLKELKIITDGEIETASQLEKIRNWANVRGVFLPDLRADTVKQFLIARDTPKEVKDVLRVRSFMSMSSNKKYFSFLDRTCEEDDRARDILMFHGASTGRDSGRGIQVHNFPRGSIKNTNEAIEDIQTCEPEDLKILYGYYPRIFSSCLRGMIEASPGHELFVADYNAIECRILHWISDNKSALKDYRNGVDRYIKMASLIYGIDQNLINAVQRFIGKQTELGCGYGMGHLKFYNQCVNVFKVNAVTKELAKKAVTVYRNANYAVTQCWYNVEQAAITAVRNPGTTVKIHKVAYFTRDNFLWCQLPSGRRIAYYKPTIKMKPTPWGEDKPALHFWTSNSQTHKWERRATYGGFLVENICQAIARDVMANGQLNLKNNGFKYLFNVHDELVGEAIKSEKTLEEFKSCLLTLPDWAEGLPVKAEGFKGPRFRK